MTPKQREEAFQTFRPGIYKHHKGGYYRALFLARDITEEIE